jgi:hypothetical protein
MGGAIIYRNAMVAAFKAGNEPARQAQVTLDNELLIYGQTLFKTLKERQ